jgi:hypothetical protein
MIRKFISSRISCFYFQELLLYLVPFVPGVASISTFVSHTLSSLKRIKLLMTR